MRCQMYCGLSDDDDLAGERLFDRCGWKSAHGHLRVELLGSKPEWLLRILRGGEVTGHG